MTYFMANQIKHFIMGRMQLSKLLLYLAWNIITFIECQYTLYLNILFQARRSISKMNEQRSDYGAVSMVIE